MEVTGAALAASFTRRFSGGPTIQAELQLPATGFSVTVLFGPSGGGKTTVLRCLAGLDRPDRGRITFGPETWFDSASGSFVPPQQRAVGYLAQDYALFPHLRVAANIGYGLKTAPPQRQAQVAVMVQIFSLAGLEDRYPRQLSGGQQQRVALARALVRQPRLLLLDEPFAALDLPTRAAMRGELRRWLAGAAVPAILVTHDRIEALSLGDNIVVLAEGKMLQTGPVPEVFSRPASAAVAELVGVETVEPARVLDVADGLTKIAVNEVQLFAVGNAVQDRDAFICIRGEDVVLDKGAASATSARNRLSGVVRSLVQEGPLVRVELDCGFRLTALVTGQACRDLDLREGNPVTALVKAPAIHLVPR